MRQLIEVDMNLRHNKGFTLIEMLLVMVIIASFIYMGAGYMEQRALSLRIDRTSGQMQQILNAGMSYYIANNKWPTSMSDLQNSGYLPSNLASPWGSSYAINYTNNNLYVSMQLPSAMSAAAILATAKTIAGTLPLAYMATSIPAADSAPVASATCPKASCYVVASVNVPGQSLSNASSVNFTALYHSGACVPEPSCPTDFEAQIIAVPVAVNAIYDQPGGGAACNPTSTAGCTVSYVQLSGFTAYATSNDAATNPIVCSNTGSSATAGCTATVDALGNKTPVTGTGKYWRVCLSVTTSSGEIPYDSTYANNNPWGQVSGTILVMTRCQAKGAAPGGSDFSVWEPNS